MECKRLFWSANGYWGWTVPFSFSPQHSRARALFPPSSNRGLFRLLDQGPAPDPTTPNAAPTQCPPATAPHAAPFANGSLAQSGAATCMTRRLR